MTRKRKTVRLTRSMEQAIMTGNVDQFFSVLDEQQRRAEAARKARGPSQSEINIARMRRARGMEYDKWALGETE